MKDETVLPPQRTQTSAKSAENARRRLLQGTALATGAGLVIPSRYTRPIIDAVFLPSHAQMSDQRTVIPPTVTTPRFSLSRVLADLRTPSGEVVAVDALSRVRLWGCDLPAGETVTVICTAGLSPTGTIMAFTQSGVVNAGGNLIMTGVVNSTVLIQLDSLLTLEFQVVSSSGIEVFTADPDAVSDAVAGPVTPVAC